MKPKPCTYSKAAAAALGALALVLAAQGQTVTNPAPNAIISWNLDNNSTILPTDLAGLAPATNWVDTYLNNITIGLPDNTGTTTTMNLGYGSVNTWSVQGSHPGYDADGTANREMLNGYLNSGPAAWGPSTTNTYVAFTNVPYPLYDVVIYFNSDTSGRHGTISDGTTTYSFSTVGAPSINGANALFLPTTQTNSSVFPSADFAYFRGETSPNLVITTYPKSGNDQWLGIAACQVIQASDAYVLYGPTPASETIPVGQPLSLSVLAGGQNPQYQWLHNGAVIPNATNATYSVASTVAGQDGNYSVVVTNSFNAVTSAVATVTFYTPKTLTWAGVGSTWDTNSPNWILNGASTNYTETDNVRFDSVGVAQPTVTLSGTHTPSSITVSNATTYMLTSGSLAGNGSMRLMNNSLLVLDTADNRMGPTLVDSGSTLQLDQGDTAGSLPPGPLTNNGTLLLNSSGDLAYGYPIYGTGSITNIGASGTITLASTVNGNYLVQAGGGTLLLQGSNALTGGLVVSSGTVWARGLGCLGNAPVTLSGGELQLIYSFDFVAPSLTMSGGLLHGVGGASTFEGQVSLTTDSEIDVDNGSTLTLNSPVGVNGGSFNLLLGGGGGTLALNGTNNSWASFTIYNGTLQIGSGGTAGSLGAGAISDGAALAFDLAGNFVLTNTVTGVGAINQNGSGTLTLAADNAGNGFSGPINANAGTLLIDGTSGPGLVTVSNAVLGGTGTIGSGGVAVMPGATLAPSAGSSSVSTLTIGGNVIFAGNLSVNVNTSQSPSNDLIVVSGSLANSSNGVVTVHNIGPALKPGEKFYLFSQPLSGGDTMSVTGGGAVWTNMLATDGSIQVLSVVQAQPPVINAVSVAGSTNLVFSGTNGVAGQSYDVLSTTNLALPLTQWTVEASGQFGAGGTFSVTNPIVSGTPQKFYLLQAQ